jgi:hypothetical protein
MPTAVRESRYQTHEHPLQDRREKNLDLVRLVWRKENTDAAQGTDYSPDQQNDNDIHLPSLASPILQPRARVDSISLLLSAA